eukprot:GHVU01022490.1.p1 GENE.GHVU01022490.1~~GHVU01022490.1.p1  ORF type:complete len:116 (+),score=11.06 GHVU01022490.1:66-413(+)
MTSSPALDQPNSHAPRRLYAQLHTITFISQPAQYYSHTGWPSLEAGLVTAKRRCGSDAAVVRQWCGIIVDGAIVDETARPSMKRPYSVSQNLWTVGTLNDHFGQAWLVSGEVGIR